MPKVEAKIIQKELASGRIWPVYWIYGAERMKSRELLKLIRKAVTPEGDGNSSAGFGSFNEESLEGGEVSASEVVDLAQTLSLGGGVRFVIIRDAHLIKDAEELAPLLGPAATRDQLPHCCVFLSKDLDGRKKFSKILIEKAAVIACEEVPEDERESWIGYLAKRRGINLPGELVARLRGLDPWALDSVDSELEKYSLALTVDPESAAAVVLGGVLGDNGSEAFLDAFFRRDTAKAMAIATSFAEAPDESLPLLGLLSWNVRQLALVVSDREQGTRYAKLSSFLAGRFDAWSRRWKLDEIEELQSALAELDFGLKQTPKLPQGLWAELISMRSRSN